MERLKLKYIAAMILIFSFNAKANGISLVDASKLVVEKLNFNKNFIDGIRYSASNQSVDVSEELVECIIKNSIDKLPNLYAEAARENQTTDSVLLYGELFSSSRGDRFMALVNREVDFSSVSDEELKSFKIYHVHRDALLSTFYKMDDGIRNLIPVVYFECSKYMKIK